MFLSKLIQVIPDSISQESINIDSFARNITVKHTPSKSPAPKKLYSDQTSKSSRKSLFKENVLPVLEDENQPITDMVDMLANIV